MFSFKRCKCLNLYEYFISTYLFVLFDPLFTKYELFYFLIFFYG